MTKLSHCHECSKEFATRRADAVFCSTECRKAFNNRRAVRGAELYDLFRALRRDRAKAKELNVWTALCRLELRWHQEDQERAPHGKTYRDAKTVMTEMVDDGRLPRGEILFYGKRPATAAG